MFAFLLICVRERRGCRHVSSGLGSARYLRRIIGRVYDGKGLRLRQILRAYLFGEEGVQLVLGVVLHLRLALQVLQVLERIPSVAVVDEVLEKGGVVALDGFCDVGVGSVVVPRPFVVAVGVVVVGVVVVSASQVREQSCEGLLKKEREKL